MRQDQEKNLRNANIQVNEQFRLAKVPRPIQAAEAKGNDKQN